MKGLEYEYRTVGLIDKENRGSEFKKINPYGQVPALIIDDSGKQVALFQSLAILQYLDEAYPNTTPVLPADPLTRAKVRIVSDCIAAGIQPLQNLPVISKMNEINGSGLDFVREMMLERFADLELILTDYSGKCCVGNDVTMADLCLAPQVYNAHRYGVDMSSFPIINRINEHLLTLDAFARGHPSKQPDAPVQS